MAKYIDLNVTRQISIRTQYEVCNTITFDTVNHWKYNEAYSVIVLCNFNKNVLFQT